MTMEAGKLIGFIVSVVLAFFLLSSTWSTLETGTSNLQTRINGSHINESAGTGNNTGGVYYAVSDPPVDTSGVQQVYCNSTTVIPSTNWTLNTTHLILYGANNSVCNGTAVTLTYESVTMANSVASLPSTSALIFILVVLFGIVILVVRGSGI